MNKLFPLSVVVLAKNEAENVSRCLQSVSWCAERVVVDDYSSDATACIAEECGARVVQRRFDSFARQRNWTLDQAGLSCAWVLMLDADEVMTEPLRAEIERELSSVGDHVVGFRTCRKTMFFGRWLKRTDGFPVWIMRLVRRGSAYFEDQGHGEVPVPKVDGSIETLAEPFLHYPFSRGIGEWMERHNRYAAREAALELSEQQSVRWRDVFRRDRALRRQTLRAISRKMPLRPALRFFYQYVLKGGFLEGRGGLAFSFLMATYEGLIVLKRWELELQEKGRQL